MKDGGDKKDHGRWLAGEHDPALVELRQALDEARRRTPDEVTLRRMWGHVAEPGPAQQAAEPADARRPGRRRAPRWLWFAGGVASTAAAALALSMWLSPRAPAPAPPAPKVSTAPAERPSVAPAPTPARESRPTLAAPGRVRTAAGESLQLALPGGADARLGPSSVLKLDAEERPVVEAGEVAFQVEHQPPGRSFVVQAGPYRVVVVGTKFRLSVDERHRVFVSVEEGQVEIRDRTRLAQLAPGEHWASPEGPEPTHIAPAPSASRARAGADVRRQADSAGPAEAAPPSSVTTEARAALAAGEVQRALSLYRGLAQRGGPAGENAEYEVGRILLDRLGQPAGAIATWRHYRGEHPNGLLRVEADVSIIEALVHAGDLDAALAEGDDFLRHHPNSERRAEIARVSGDLYRARGDCTRAVAAYETALGAPRNGGVREAASFHRASCLVKLGDPSGRTAARAYLATWPSGRFRDQAAELAAAGRSGR